MNTNVLGLPGAHRKNRRVCLFLHAWGVARWEGAAIVRKRRGGAGRRWRAPKCVELDFAPVTKQLAVSTQSYATQRNANMNVLEVLKSSVDVT